MKDEILFRQLKKGSQYNSLFPSATCERVELGKGDTDYSIDKMVEWILIYQEQTIAIAKQLQKSSLQNTCASIHDFLYWHFQYKADSDDQLLRSPACAWKQRHDGIDCKSYSIVASCCLLSLGITHYIKKVAYSAPGEYSHVYVVVPKNQQSNNLDEGYYMIDGTINTLQEPYYLDSKEEYMSLPHYGLNRPNSPQLNGVNLSFLKKISLNSVKGFISSIRCWGGSAYTGDLLDQNIAKATALFNEITDDMNQSIADGNWDALAESAQDFWGMSAILRSGNWASHNDGWNPCSSKNFYAMGAAMQFFNETAAFTLKGFFDKYFTVSQVRTDNYTNVGLEGQGWVFMEGSGGPYTYAIPLYKLTPKNYVTPIPAFEYTVPVMASFEAGIPAEQWDIPKILDSLQNFIHVFTQNSGNGNGTGTGTGTIIDAGGGNPKDTDQAGMGTIAGLAIVTAGLMYAFSQSPDKPTAKKQLSKPKKQKQSKSKKSTS